LKVMSRKKGSAKKAEHPKKLRSFQEKPQGKVHTGNPDIRLTLHAIFLLLDKRFQRAQIIATIGESMAVPPSRSARSRRIPWREDVHTERLLLHLIHRRQPIARAELSEFTGLPLSTVAFNVNRLLKSGWIIESDAGLSNGGRPARHLHVNGEKMYLFGVDIGVTDTALAIADFNAQIIFSQRLPTKGDPRTFINKLGARILHLMKNEYAGRLFGHLGVSVPALVDTQTGELVRAPNLGWSNVPVQKWFQEVTHLPVLVDNDANAAALAEMWHGDIARKGIENMLYILVVEGLGSALIVGGKIYRGSRIGTGGFGHMCIIPNGPKCTCGGRGCLEVLASNRAIRSAYQGKSRANGRELSVTDIINLARRGEERAQNVLREAAENLAIALRSLVHGLAPPVVIVGGELAEAWFLIGPILTDKLQSNLIVPELSMIQVLPSVVRNRPSLVGAVTMGAFPELVHSSERYYAVDLRVESDGQGAKSAPRKAKRPRPSRDEENAPVLSAVA
jgi:predicted NBD/HSP70 family sugar kinase